MRKALTVFVRNNGDTPFNDRYDGEDFIIEPGRAVEMEADCAKLVFGFGEKDKSRAIRRLGWAPTSADVAGAMKLLYTFSFYSTKEELDAAIGAEKASLTAPASGVNAAGEGSPPPAAVGQAVEGSRVIGNKADAADDVRVEPAKRERDEPRPRNAMANIAAVANAAG